MGQLRGRCGVSPGVGLEVRLWVGPLVGPGVGPVVSLGVVPGIGSGVGLEGRP